MLTLDRTRQKSNKETNRQMVADCFVAEEIWNRSKALQWIKGIQTDRQTDLGRGLRQVERQAEKQTDKQTNKQTDKQTDNCRYERRQT